MTVPRMNSLLSRMQAIRMSLERHAIPVIIALAIIPRLILVQNFVTELQRALPR